MSGGLITYKSYFQLSPIYLTGSSSSTQSIAGSTRSLISLLPATAGTSSPELDDAFAHFIPQPGATLLDFAVATYPFANQAVAGNALIAQPLQIAMRMLVPVRPPNNFWTKYATMIGLRETLYQHSSQGGTYTIATPSYVYVDALLTKMHDITGGESAQAQLIWQLDFVKPLLTIADAQAAQSSQYQKLSNGAQVTSSDASGVQVNTGTSSPGLSGGSPGSTAVGGSVSSGAYYQTGGFAGLGGSIASSSSNTTVGGVPNA